MNELHSLVTAMGFRLVRGAGGAEQYRWVPPSTHTLPLWLVLTKKTDPLAIPTTMSEPVNLAVSRTDPDDPSSYPRELVFANTGEALSHVLRNYIWGRCLW